MSAHGLNVPATALTSPDGLTSAPASSSATASPRVVHVVVCTDDRQGCRSFRCPRQAELVVKYDHERPEDPNRDWFWCLGHWPALAAMFLERNYPIQYSPEARVLVDAVADAGAADS
jgi:hypothetical protein